MKKLLALLLALIMVLSLAACGTTPTASESGTAESGSESASESEAATPESQATHLALDGWDETVKTAVNDMFDAYGKYSEGYDENAKPYVVFDFDNTCSIFDVEEQLAVYQLQVMAFAFTPDELPGILATGLSEMDKDRSDLEYGKGSYNDWIADITAAYKYLYETYGPFTAAGLDEAKQATVQADPEWSEFATKMRTMYDLVYDAESASVAYPWVLYWFTGMTEDEVYALATGSHSKYKEVETSEVTWTSPADIESKVGQVEYTWTSGTQVTENLKELWADLQANGFDVWVCSASATDPIRAAVDVWGLRDYLTGMMAMTNTLVDGKYTNSYDYDTGYAWLVENGEWVKGDVATKAQTQGAGKVTAVENVLVTKYGYGPIAGFMDSTGDFNFCTEFDSLKLVLCFNRASRKITDGGGLVAIAAVYESDDLGYDFAKADAAGDIMFVLQGRDETGLRTLSGTRETMRYGADAPKLFANDDVVTLYNYVKENKLTIKDFLDTFAVKTAADAEGNPIALKFGCLKEYNGYKTRKYTATADGWDETVKQAINDFTATYGKFSANYDSEKHPYVVFDFDNTCSIFDVEEQLAVYQLQVMAFAFTPDELPGILATGLSEMDKDRSDLEYGKGSYNDWIADITAAYKYLYETYGPFTAAGLDEAKQATVQADPEWSEFATKMRTMYDLVYDAESADVAYPWVLYWFTGMTEDEVYALATGSHTKYKAVETSEVTWTSPADIESKVGQVEYTWTSGTQVTNNIRELWQVLDSNGIDVWVCSASATDPVRAAIDVWGLHDFLTGELAMTNTLVDGKYTNNYDYNTGYAWLNEGGKWVKGDVATKAQTQGPGKVTAINNVLKSSYGYGPSAGFMDSTGDFYFCTEYESLKMVICFNRASRKITDGGGLVSIAAVYENDDLGYNLASANEAGDIYFVLQGRDETGLRTFSGTRETMRYGADAPKLFANDDVVTLYNYVKENKLTIADFLNTFALKTAADAEGNPIALKFGCAKEYPGYKSIK